MTMRILAIVLMTFGSASLTPLAQANELDNENLVINEQAVLAQNLPATVVVRVNEASGEAQVLESARALTAIETEKSSLAAANFKSLPKAPNELDQASSTASWYAWYPRGYYFAPTYYYSGYTYGYRNYYSYSYYGYSYYWYRWY